MLDPILSEIIRAPRAWTSAGRLVKKFGAAAIRQAAQQGKIKIWAYDRRGRRLRAPAYTLSAGVAWKLKVTITEVPNRLGMGTPFWSSGQDEHGRPRRPVRLSTPRPIPDPKADGSAKGSVVKDPDGKPLVVLGVEARADPRLARTPPRRRR